MSSTTTHSRILVVDDSSFARRRLSSIFEHAGHEVVGNAQDGAQALMMFETLHPDVVTLDYLMKDECGVDVLKDIIRRDPAAKVIIISGSGHSSIEKESLAAGAVGFVDKFNDKRIFLSALDHAMSV